MAIDNKNLGYLEHPYQTNYWIDVSKEVNKYRFLEDTRYGTGGYKNGFYLIPHKREDKNDYLLRSSKSYFGNQYKAILDAHYKPIFKNPAVREIADNTNDTFRSLYQVFINNADGKGNSLQSLMESASGKTKNKGVSFLVMNNDVEIDTTIEDVLERRQGVPYVFVVTPDMINTYETDSFGNLVSLEWFQRDGVLEREVLTSDGYKGEIPDSPNTFYSNKREGYIIVGVNASSWYIKDDKGEIIDAVDNTIGRLPVVSLTEDVTDEIIPESSLYSIARLQHRIFNLSSIITDVADNQGFSIFTMPVDVNSGIEFSTTKGISYPKDSSNKPEFISPDASQLKTLIELLNSLVHEMYQAGSVSHLQRFQQSAESKELDRQRLNDLLGTFKRQVESTERKLMSIFGDFVGFDYEYNVYYSDDFGVSTLSERIDRFSDLANTGAVSRTLMTELEKELAVELLDLEDEEMKQEFLDRIDVEKALVDTQELIDDQV